MTPAGFVAAFKPYADGIAAATGLSPWLFLSQWAVETNEPPPAGLGGSPLATACHNLAGIRPNAQGLAHPGVSEVAGPFLCFPNLDTFRANYLEVIAHPDYAGVRQTAGYALWSQMVALGLSPWDAGHYAGRTGAAGVALGHMYDSTFKAIAEPPPPAPTPTLVTIETLAAAIEHLVAEVGVEERQENNVVVVAGTGLWGHVSALDDTISRFNRELHAVYDDSTPLPTGALPAVQELLLGPGQVGPPGSLADRIASLERAVAALQGPPPAPPGPTPGH